MCRDCLSSIARTLVPEEPKLPHDDATNGTKQPLEPEQSVAGVLEGSREVDQLSPDVLQVRFAALLTTEDDSCLPQNRCSGSGGSGSSSQESRCEEWKHNKSTRAEARVHGRYHLI